MPNFEVGFDPDPITVHIEGGEPSPRRSRESAGASDNGELARARLQNARMERQAQLHAAETAALTAKSEADAAQHAYEQASELGDVRAQAEAMRRVSSAEAKQLKAEQDHEYLRRAPVTSGDPVEDFASTRTDRTASWLREHRDWVTDQRKWTKVQGAHNLAVGDGLVPDSDEYFAYVEKTLGIRGGDNGGGRSKGSMRSGGSSGDGGRVTLSKSEVEMANSGAICWNAGNTDANGNVLRHGDARIGKPIGNFEYARRKQAQVAAGLHNKLG